MTDIFLSYAREDLAKTKKLAVALEKQGWSVFWDRTSLLAGQDFEQVIEQAIEKAGCMIVAWSKASIKSDWVRGEADIGRKRKILVPILFDLVDPPIAFRALHTENFVAWKGDIDSSCYLALCKALTERLGQTKGSVSGTDKASHQSINEPKKPEIRWPRQLTVKVGKITGIIASLAFLGWMITIRFIEKNPEKTSSEVLNIDTKGAGKPIAKEPVRPKDPSGVVFTLRQMAKEPVMTEPEMVKIPAGRFQMGNQYYQDEQPAHTVSVKSFAIGRYEVTFDEYDQFAEAVGKPKPNDYGWGRGNRPVINASWEDAVAYTQWLSTETGKQFRLPTEAEWEYAARAGTVGDYYWDQNDPKDFAWFTENSEGKTHTVGTKKPNGFGLYDMSGNVWEWAQDCWHENYENAPTDGSAWEKQNNGDCTRRAMRGLSWNYGLVHMRSAVRSWLAPDTRLNIIGFRLAQN